MKRIHYAWFICIGCTLMLFCSGGLGLTGFAPYLPYLVSMKGLSNTQVSSIIFVRTLFGVFGMMLTTAMIRRFNVRMIIVLSLFLEAVGFVLYGMVNSFLGFCAAAAIVGMTYGLTSMISASILVTRWFHANRGIALGICAAATGVSTFLASPIITLVIERFSLRTSFTSEAVFILICAGAVCLMVRNNPDDLGMKPLGDDGTVLVPVQSYAHKTASRSLLMIMMVGLLLFGAAANNLSNALSMLFSSVGYSASGISAIVSLFGISLAFGKCIYGYLSDRIGVFKACNILYISTMTGTLICCFAKNINFYAASFGACLMGIGIALASVAVSTYAIEVASEKDYPSIVSNFQTTQTFGGLVFVTVPGIIEDKTGR